MHSIFVYVINYCMMDLTGGGGSPTERKFDKGCVSLKKYYYAAGNTSAGFVNLIKSNVHYLKQIISLKHPSHRLKTAILQEIIETYEQKEPMEILKSSLGEAYIDGVILPQKSIAILDNYMTKELEDVVELDLERFFPKQPPKNQELYAAYEGKRKEAYDSFAQGLAIHDDLEAIYVREMDFSKADRLAERFIAELVTVHPDKNKKSRVTYRFFGTNTRDGVVNVVPHIIESIPKVYYIKGRAGTGKSTFMKKVGNACSAKGYDVFLYRCSFDPNSLDMVHVPELGFSMFDSTEPHEFFPGREGEEIIDLYEETVTPGTDEKYADEIGKITRHYKSFMKKGIVYLKEAGEIFDQIEETYPFDEETKGNIASFILTKVIS